MRWLTNRPWVRLSVYPLFQGLNFMPASESLLLVRRGAEKTIFGYSEGANLRLWAKYAIIFGRNPQGKRITTQQGLSAWIRS